MQQIEKVKQVDIDFSSHQKDWKQLEQDNTSTTPNFLFVSYNSEEIKMQIDMQQQA